MSFSTTTPRRAMLQGLAAAPAGLALSAFAPKAKMGKPDEAMKSTITAGFRHPVVEIETGRVAGFERDGICAFLGIPYAADTGGEHRFLPPRKPSPWDGTRSSLHYGPVCPQDKGMGRFNDEEAFIFQWNDSVEREDCLRINVWTPGPDTQKRPVMVWLHGGGFTAGSGHDLPAFDGHNLAKRGDVIVVTLNHRLNLLGFLDLSGHHEDFAQSGNVGMLDIVAALQWIRDNIAAFGGDPSCVTIFGQSGGGAKVSTLMGMPAAKGLFHRAIVQSGSFAMAQTRKNALRLAALIMTELGVKRGEVTALHKLPYARLRAASETVLKRENPASGFPLDTRSRPRYGFGPVLDGKILPAVPFAPDASTMSANVPLMVGTTLNEFITGINNPAFEQLTDAELMRHVERAYPERGAAVVEAFRKSTPQAKPCDLWSRIATAPIRKAAIAQARAQMQLGGAPVWLYLFSRTPPILDGRPRAFHCAEIPYVFANADRCASMTGGDTAAAALEGVMADAWIAFARSGNPNHSGMERWDPVSANSIPSMIFDDSCRQELAPDAAELSAIG